MGFYLTPTFNSRILLPYILGSIKDLTYMEEYCKDCGKIHKDRKWYNVEIRGKLYKICRKSYMQRYYIEHANAINNDRREKYVSDEGYRKEVLQANKEYQEKCNAKGIKQKRKPRSEFTEDQRRKAYEAKLRWQDAHKDQHEAYIKKYRKEYYEINKEEVLRKNEEYRKTPEGKYHNFTGSLKRRNCTNELTLASFIKKIYEPCHYCTIPAPEQGHGLDRLVNTIRVYSDNDSEACCKVCNYRKHKYLTEEENLFATLAIKQFHIDGILPVKVSYGMATYPNEEAYTPERRHLMLKAREIPSSLTKEQIELLRKKPCFYCDGPLPPKGTGLDRFNNEEEYHLIASVPCCHVCNGVKGDIFSGEETYVMINAVQRIRIYREKVAKLNIIPRCCVCGATESSKWIKHPDKDEDICDKHYHAFFVEKNKYLDSQFDVAAINQVYQDRLAKRKSSPRPKKGNTRRLQAYTIYSDLITSRGMTLETTLKEYLESKEKRIEMKIRCEKGHIFSRLCERIKDCPDCPDCKGHSNKGGSYIEKLSERGWKYISGEYKNKESELTVECRERHRITRRYRYLKDQGCTICQRS